MKILSLLGQDTFVENIVMDYTNEWVDEVIITHNVFKAKDFSNEYENKDSILDEIVIWVFNNNNALVEVKELL